MLWQEEGDGEEMEQRPGETDREFKKRMLVAKIRAEAKAKASGKSVPQTDTGKASKQPAVAKAGATKRKTPDGPAPPPGAPPTSRQKQPGKLGKPAEPPGPPPEDTEPAPPAAPPGHRNKKKEDDDARKFDAMLPIMEAKVASVEDEAEKVSILAAPLAMEAVDELRELQTGAVRDTERAVRASLASARKAKEELEKRRKEVKAMEFCVREGAEEEVAKFEQRLEAAQAKLDEFKNARKDHEVASTAVKAYDELATKLASVEVDCEKAAMMAEPLAKVLEESPDELANTSVRETKEALRVAQATLAPTLRLISGKVPNLKGAVRNKMLDLQARAEASQSLLEKAQNTVDEAQSRAMSMPILKQAGDRLAAIEEILLKMRETEAPFLMGLESMPPQESTDALQKMEKAASLAHAALADAHKYIALKLVEVGRLSEGAAADARKELEKAKAQIDEGVERVRSFQAETGKRKRSNVVSLIKLKIDEAEAAVAKMKEAGSEIKDADAEFLPEALERAMAAELEAQSAVATARRELQEKQTDLRPKDAGGQGEVVKNSSEILKTKVRVQALESDLAKFRKMVKDYDEKMRVGKSLSELQDTVRDAEADTERISELSKAWQPEEEPPEEETKGIAGVQGKITTATTQVEEKLKSAQGLELKELRSIFQRLQKAQGKIEGVRESVRTLARSSSTRIVKEGGLALQRLEQKISALATGAAKTLEQLEKLHDDASQVNPLIADAKKALAGGQEASLQLEAKVEFARLQLRSKAAERRCRNVVDSISRRMETATADATRVALDALRSCARDENGMYEPDVLFQTISGGEALISQQQLQDFLQHSQEEVPADKARIAARRLAPYGMTSGAFCSKLQNFMKVIKEITLTGDFEIQTAKMVRKLRVGEVLQIISDERLDDTLGLRRVQARGVSDGAQGWVTSRNVSGTTYLGPADKPFLWCAQSVQMRESQEEESVGVRDLKQGEVLELVVGPREESHGSGTRVRGVACHESNSGWLQVKDKSGTVLAKLSKHIYKCTEAIAMTNVADLGACSMVRRIDAGEALELLPEEAEVQPSEGGSRRKFRACRDKCEGWVTVQGSQGTRYAAPAPKHYICQQATPVHAGLGAESAVVRVLMEGEAFSAFEEPRDVSGAEKVLHYSVRAVTDGSEGWVTTPAGGDVQPWSSRYTVIRSVPLTSAFAANEAAEVIEVVRLLETDEIVDAMEPPTEDRSTGLLRLRVVALSDKAVGWATIREGSALTMRPATKDQIAAATRVQPSAQSASPSTPLGGPAPSTPPKGTGKGTKRPAPPSQPPWAYHGKGGGKWHKAKGR